MRMAHHHTEMLSDAEFLEQFDAGTLDLDAFDHEAHVRAAWLCLRAAPFREAVARLRRGLKRLAISAGQPQRYHETITVAYARLIHKQMRLLNDPPWQEFTAQSPDLLGPDLAAVRALYGQEALDAPESRKTFVPPPAWNLEPVERFLREFTAWQEDLDARPAEPVTPADTWPGDDARAVPNPRAPRRCSASPTSNVRRGGTPTRSVSMSRRSRNGHLTNSRCCRVAAPS